MVNNPLTWAMIKDSAPLYVLLHYLDYGIGLYLGISLGFKVGWKLGIPLGVVGPIVWHLPVPFTLAASQWQFDLLAFFTLVVSGTFMGLWVKGVGRKLKFSLLGMWMTGDTILSTLFMTGGTFYSNIYLNSPYGPGQLEEAGIVMFLFMNIVIVILIIKLLNDMFNAELRGEEN